MQETAHAQQTRSADQSIVWNALIALAIGGLLAVLVSVPYAQVFGVSPALCVGLKYLASFVVLTCLAGGRSAERVPPYRAVALQPPKPRSRTYREQAWPRGLKSDRGICQECLSSFLSPPTGGRPKGNLAA
jgi:hypothetical protein